MIAGTGRLYRPDLFEPLPDAAWNQGRVRDAIAAIVAEVDRAFRGPDLWPTDPVPVQGGWNTPDPMASLYEGAAGTLYALEALRRRGLAATNVDVGTVALDTLERFRADPDFAATTVPLSEPRAAALLAGATGILLLAWRLAPATELADHLERRIRENVGNDADEVMWGTPGTLLAATTMLRWTGAERWRQVARVSVEALLARRNDDDLWTQHLYGQVIRRLDPIHGAAGIFLAVRSSLEGNARAAFERRASDLFRGLAVVDHGLANWPVAVGDDPGPLRWCAGAPGVIAAAAPYLDEDLLVAAGELVWQAGAPRLGAGGPGICCGTSGNGYALLKIFERTADQRWLDRARRFAVHALAQAERDRARGGPGWHSLWRGDPGVALFAADCLEARARYPVLDD